MKTAKAKSQPIRLTADVSPEGQASSTIPVRWCVSRETVQEFKDKGIKPRLLLVVSSDKRETDRYLVPVTDEMVYVRFRRPGRNLIHATLVWQKEGYDDPKKIFFKRDDEGRFRTEVIATQRPRVDAISKQIQELEVEHESLAYGYRRGKVMKRINELAAERSEARQTEPEIFGIRQDFNSIERLDYEEEMRVAVPDEMFAKEPPKWLKRFVGFFFKTKLVDQCHFRRQVIFSVLLAPLYMVYLMAKELVILGSLGVLLFAGRRRINFRPAINPVHHTPKDTWRNVHSMFWFETKRGELSPLATFNPLVIAISFIVTLFTTIIWSEASFKGDKAQGQHFDHLWGGTWWIYLIGVFAPAAIGVVISLVFLLTEGVAILVNGVAMVTGEAKKTSVARQFLKKRRERRRTRQLESQRRALEAEKAFYAELETLSCNGDRKAGLKELPKERRTIYLRFQAVKAAVCRPYAK